VTIEIWKGQCSQVGTEDLRRLSSIGCKILLAKTSFTMTSHCPSISSNRQKTAVFTVLSRAQELFYSNEGIGKFLSGILDSNTPLLTYFKYHTSSTRATRASYSLYMYFLAERQNRLRSRGDTYLWNADMYLRMVSQTLPSCCLSSYEACFCDGQCPGVRLLELFDFHLLTVASETRLPSRVPASGG